MLNSKKIPAILLLILATACTSPDKTPLADVVPVEKPASLKAGAKTTDKSCQNVLGVKDPENGGNIYYEKSHHLYKFIKLDKKQGDKNFCSVDAAKKGGFNKEAPEYFKDSTKNLIICLSTENERGKCHDYIFGIYQSLKIYDKVCGPAGVSRADMADIVENYAKKTKDGMDVSRYHGAATAFLNKYPCKGGK